MEKDLALHGHRVGHWDQGGLLLPGSSTAAMSALGVGCIFWSDLFSVGVSIPEDLAQTFGPGSLLEVSNIDGLCHF
jgi:hypothetical protein